jgi:hypothetical protein
VRRLTTRAALCTFLAVSALGSARAGEPVRLDASSDRAAVDSFSLMLAGLSREEQEDLQFAMLKINMDGVGSAAEMLADPALRAPTIARIKDRVAGMTAAEIIAEADAVTSVQMVRPGR